MNQETAILELKAIEQPQLNARFETPERTLTIANYNVKKFKF